MNSLNPHQTKIHETAMSLANQLHSAQAELVKILREVEGLKIHHRLNKGSLFQYATECLRLDEAIAYSLITVARKTVVIPELEKAIAKKTLSVSKANRIVSTLTVENADELIQFASAHTKSEIEFEMAKRNPKLKTYDKMKAISEDSVEIKVTITRETFEKLKRVESLIAQKNQEAEWGSLIDKALDQYLEKHDPVKKAKRAQNRKLCLGRVKSKSTRTTIAPSGKVDQRRPLTTEQRHAVFARDHGMCTHRDIKDHRCGSDRWIDVHHIIPVSHGGTNDPQNLTTLCSFHHDLVHQLSLPIEGQVTWLRSPRIEYRL